jgi:hypothetical protein
MVLAGVAAACGPGPAPKCDDCEDEDNPADATHWCAKCEAHFCGGCVKLHFTVKSLKKHPLQTVQERIAAVGCAHGGSGGASTECHLHHKPHEFYCRSCHAIGCSTCIITGHKDHSHDTELLVVMVGPLRATLKQCGDQLGGHCSVVHEGIDHVRTTRAALDRNEKVALAAVDQAAKEVRQELQKTVTEAKAEVGRVSEFPWPSARAVSFFFSCGFSAMIPCVALGGWTCTRRKWHDLCVREFVRPCDCAVVACVTSARMCRA